MLNKTIPLVAAAAAVAAAGIYFFGQEPMATPVTPAAAETSATSTATATESTAVSLAPDMILGNVDAPVTVIEYASFTCPHCANFHKTVFDQFKANYIDSGKVKFVYREVYFDKFGLWAGMVARCDGPEKYFAVSDMLYDEQRDWLAPNAEDGIAAELKKIGIKAGMTAENVEACLKDEAKAKAMVEAYQTNATKDDVTGTPTFIINGKKANGEMSYDAFAELLDAAAGE
ncbi:MAG: DsbA family protein [Paracoccaceae bacterium]